jgi:hypothetical protein
MSICAYNSLTAILCLWILLPLSYSELNYCLTAQILGSSYEEILDFDIVTYSDEHY